MRTYLGNAGATQAMPIDRLRHMNPLAIELYRRYKIDIAAEPLEFAVNNQHMNGGIAVDTWARSSLRGRATPSARPPAPTASPAPAARR